jgi:cytochrome c biogenesis protein
MLRDMALPQRTPSDSFLTHRREHATFHNVAAAEDRWRQALAARGYHLRSLSSAGNQQMLFAQKGRFYRLGYILTHFAIILFCIGALYNANLPLKVQEWLGEVHALKNFSLPLAKIPQRDWLPTDESAFRGIISIPVGQSVNAMFELVGDGFLVQHLPFTMRLDHFTITHYRNGIAKSFVSALSLFNKNGQLIDSGTAQPNHPLVYDGISIFQTSYSNGQSLLTFQSHSLINPTLTASQFRGHVGQKLQTSGDSYALTIEKLKINNTIPRRDLGLPSHTGDTMINVGPIVRYQVVDLHTATHWVYKSYLQPLQNGGQRYLLLAYHRVGVGHEHYLAIPEGPHGGIGLFVHYFGALEQAAAKGATASATVFERVLQRVCLDRGIALSKPEQASFLHASLIALHDLHSYPLPFLITLQHVQLIWSAGLEVTKYPGMGIVYGACLLLVGGIFILFYIPRKRLWIDLRNHRAVSIFGDSSRNQEDFHQEFLDIVKEFSP